VKKSLSAEIICVGTELLLGDIVNTNAVYLSRELATLGINVYRHETVGDNDNRLCDSLRESLLRSDIIITSGGLGPTYDDITKETVCKVMNSELVLDEKIAAGIRAFFEGRGKVMPENNLKQALVPKDGFALENPYGTAPGICIRKEGKTVIMLPGPPRELQGLFADKVIPILKEMQDDRVIVSKSVNVYGMGESAVEKELRDIMESTNPTLAPYAKDGEVLLRITASAENSDAAELMIDEMLLKVRQRINEYIYGINEYNLQSVLVKRFMEKNITVSCAESCTGGLVSQRITQVSGASNVFLGSVCSYANSVKKDVLGVDEKILAENGAVSEETAKEMALKVKKLTGSDISVSVTGIAGPTGGSKEKPVGLVYVGIAYKDEVYCNKYYFGRSNMEREYIRYIASSAAIAELLKATDSFNA